MNFDNISSSSKTLQVSGSIYTSPTKPCRFADLNEETASTSVFGPVPSQSEVELAISVLKDFLNVVSSPTGPKQNSVAQILESPTSKLIVSYGLGRVIEAFQLLQFDPSIKKLVVSLASDKALWGAIMSNELVQKLRGPRNQVVATSRGSASAGPELTPNVLQRICEIAKAKFVEFIEKFGSLVTDMLQRSNAEKPSPEDNREERNLSDKVGSSLLLSVVILLIVVVARA